MSTRHPLLRLRRLVARHPPPGLLPALAALNRLRYLGQARRCPLCNSGLRAFLPLPGEFRVRLEIRGRSFGAEEFETLSLTDYLCPVCRSADRDRLCALYVQRVAPSAPEGGLLLHFAPERALAAFLRRTLPLRYRSADLLRSDVDDRGVDLTELGRYATGSVGCFVCCHVLEHVPDDARAMRELCRVLAPTGWGIVLSPVLTELHPSFEDPGATTPAQRQERFGQEDHVRVYGKRDFIARLEAAGLQVAELGARFFGEEALHRAGIAPGSCLYVVHKGSLAPAPGGR